MFQFSGLASSIEDDRPAAGRVAPFGYPRIKGRSRLPAAFRSLLRPSSPPGAKASPVRPMVLVAYRACPAASRLGTLMSILALVVLFPSELFVFSTEPRGSCRLLLALCLSFHPVKEPLALPRRVENKGVEPLTPSLQS